MRISGEEFHLDRVARPEGTSRYSMGRPGKENASGRGVASQKPLTATALEPMTLYRRCCRDPTVLSQPQFCRLQLVQIWQQACCCRAAIRKTSSGPVRSDARWFAAQRRAGINAAGGALECTAPQSLVAAPRLPVVARVADSPRPYPWRRSTGDNRPNRGARPSLTMLER